MQHMHAAASTMHAAASTIATAAGPLQGVLRPPVTHPGQLLHQQRRCHGVAEGGEGRRQRRQLLEQLQSPGREGGWCGGGNGWEGSGRDMQQAAERMCVKPGEGGCPHNGYTSLCCRHSPALQGAAHLTSPWPPCKQGGLTSCVSLRSPASDPPPSTRPLPLPPPPAPSPPHAPTCISSCSRPGGSPRVRAAIRAR
jgi:hypothetical protein